MITEKEFGQLMGACTELAGYFPEGLVFIGGIAVYMHSIHHQATRDLAETTHDADLYISLADMADLREIEELTANRRLGKHQLIKRGFDFDVYTERHSNLRVAYDEVMAHAHQYDGMKVACLEHLLVLKMAAYQDRKGSVKGEKDARDLLRIATIAEQSNQGLRVELVLPYWADDEIELLKQLGKGPAAVDLAHGNVHEARAFRRHVENLVSVLEAGDAPPPPARRRTW